MASIESTQDLTQRMLGTLTSPNPGFWNCCQAKPSKVVQFDAEDGTPVWYQACAACASTVSAERIRELPGPDAIAMVRQERVAQQESAMLSDEYDNSLRVVRLPDWLGWALCLGTGVLTIACLILAAVFAA